MAIVINSPAIAKQEKKIIAKAIMSGDTLGKQLLTIVANAKATQKVTIGSVTSPLVPYTCNFADNSNVLISTRDLNVVKMMLGAEFCIDTLWQSYLSDEMTGDFVDMQAPKSFTDFLIDQITKNVSLQIERLIWQGDTASLDATLTLFDGFIKKLLADIDVIDQTILPVTSANIFDELTKVLNVIPLTLQGSYDSLIWYSSYNIASVWRNAQSKNNVVQNWGQGVRPLDFNGFILEPVAGLPANTIVVAEKNNMQFGTNTLSDFNKVKIVNLSDTTLDEKIRMRLDALAGVQYGFGSEIVLAKTA